jgi:hypothetical protein
VQRRRTRSSSASHARPTAWTRFRARHGRRHWNRNPASGAGAPFRALLPGFQRDGACDPGHGTRTLNREGNRRRAQRNHRRHEPGGDGHDLHCRTAPHGPQVPARSAQKLATSPSTSRSAATISRSTSVAMKTLGHGLDDEREEADPDGHHDDRENAAEARRTCRSPRPTCARVARPPRAPARADRARTARRRGPRGAPPGWRRRCQARSGRRARAGPAGG